MSDDWHCLQNPPRFPNNVTFVSNSFHHAYTLDEQCRMEFGDGFRFCNSFQVFSRMFQLHRKGFKQKYLKLTNDNSFPC